MALPASPPAPAETTGDRELARALLDGIDVGLCVIEMVYDADDRPVDYRIVVTNPAFEQHTGLVNATGRTVREVAPEIEGFWIERYGRIAATGVAEHFQAPSTALGRAFDVYAFRIGRPAQRRVGIRFVDETARVQAEAALQRREQHQAFLVRLSDALHALTAPAEIQATASRLLGEHLGVNRVAFAEIEGPDAVVKGAYVRDARPFPERFPVEGHGQRLLASYRRGEPVAVADVQTDPLFTAEEREGYRLAEVAAFTGVALHRRGTWAALFGTQTTQPRAWTPDELHLIDEVASRTWAAVEGARADAARQASDERYRLLESTVPALVWTTDADGRATYFNHGWMSYTGQTLSAALAPGATAEVIHPDDIEGAREAWRRAAETMEAFSYATRLRSAAGTYEWHVVRAAPLHDERGTVTGWIGSALSVHAQREAQEDLRASEARFRALASAAPQFVWTMEPDDAGEPRVTYLNDRWFEYTGQTTDEAYARGISTAIHPRDAALVGARWTDALRATTPFSSEMRLRDRNGRYEWHLARAVPVRDEATGRVTWYGASTNVHAQKVAEEALARANRTLEDRVARRTAELEDIAARLRHSETRFRLLFERAPIGIALARADGYPDAVNPALCEMLGYNEPELLTRSWMSITHPDDLGADLGLHRELVDGPRGHYEIEKRLHHAEGHVLWAHVTATAVRDPDGTLAYTVVTVQDVTERRRYEMAALEASEAERRRLSYELHDDLGQRLASAAMMTSSLARQMDAESQDLADTARRVGEILRDAVAHTRALARGLAPVDLIHEGLAEALARLCESTTTAYGLDCEMDVPDPMPVHSPSVASHLFRIVQEAVSNAARHADARTVRVTMRDDAGHVVLRVTDDGVGVPASALAEGGGLGMRAMRSRVAALGGALSFEPQTPRGTSVVVELPRDTAGA